MTKQLYKTKFYDSVTDRARNTADVVTDILSAIFHISKFVDVGSGDGIWTQKSLEKFGKKTKAYLIDLPEVKHREIFISNNNLKIISRDFNLEPYIPAIKFDLAFCTEVLEHLEELAALALLDSITSHCEIIVFSAAVPGQGGTGHVNEHPQSYWDSHLQQRGFRPFDVIRPLLSNLNSPSYYRNNLILYVNPKRFNTDRNMELQNLLSFRFGTSRDTRSMNQKIIQCVIRLFPHQTVTFISKIKKL